jgi:coatomer subunit beta'
MPLKLDIKRKLSARSDRVKSVDIHPSEPWMLVSLYNGLNRPVAIFTRSQFL